MDGSRIIVMPPTTYDMQIELRSSVIAVAAEAAEVAVHAAL